MEITGFVSSEGLAVGLPKDVRIISGRQARAARSVLGLSVRALAGASKISVSSIRRIEADQIDGVKADLPLKLQGYLERRGIEFTWDGKTRGVTWVE